MTTENTIYKITQFLLLGSILITAISLSSCTERSKTEMPIEKPEAIAHMESETPDYFLLRPEVEKAYGYSHAVKIGNSIKISGAVSMDDEGNPTAAGDLK